MTSTEFNKLNNNSKANAVWDGRLVSSRVVDDVFVQLYDLQSFLVEVCYDPMKNEILGFEVVR